MKVNNVILFLTAAIGVSSILPSFATSDDGCSAAIIADGPTSAGYSSVAYAYFDNDTRTMSNCMSNDIVQFDVAKGGNTQVYTCSRDSTSNTPSVDDQPSWNINYDKSSDNLACNVIYGNQNGAKCPFERAKCSDSTIKGGIDLEWGEGK